MNITEGKPAASYRLEILVPREQAAMVVCTLMACLRSFQYQDNCDKMITITTSMIGPTDPTKMLQEMESVRGKNVIPPCGVYIPRGVLIPTGSVIQLTQLP